MTGYLLLFGAGLIAGAINVIAGGGSFLTLPLLMYRKQSAAPDTHRLANQADHRFCQVF